MPRESSKISTELKKNANDKWTGLLHQPVGLPLRNPIR
jgi:hypothetical protein